MKFTGSALLILLVAETASAFVSPSVVRRHAVLESRMSAVANSVDVSIPYDAAARLAYDEWRKQYDKGDFDESRYPHFKANYEAITIANVSAKKKARDTGTKTPKLMTLNEFGDCTEEEYKAAMSGGATSTGNVLNKAVEAAKSQSEASSALADAADALAEEEKVSQRVRWSRIRLAE